MRDIACWLTRLGLGKYVEAFTANEIDLDALRHLSEDDLKELGLPVGPRRKVLAAIAVLVDDSLSQSSSQVIPAPVPPRSEAERLTAQARKARTLSALIQLLEGLAA